MSECSTDAQNHCFTKFVISKVEFLLYDGATVLYFGSSNITLISQLCILVKSTGKVLVVDQNNVNGDQIKSLSTVVVFQLTDDIEFFYDSYNLLIIEDSVQNVPNCIKSLLKPGGLLIAPVFEKGELVIFVIDKNEDGDIMIQKDADLVKKFKCGKSFVETLNKPVDDPKFKLEKVAKLLNCHSCLQVMTPPTFTCQNGHVLGNECKMNFAKCPKCEADFTATRFLRLDNILNELYSTEDDTLSVEKFSEGVHNLLECPVCFDIMKPPTETCINGHIVGAECKNSLMICPSCRGDFCRVKFTGLDEVLNNLNQKCDAFKKGCRKRILVKDMPDHVEHCLYCKTVQCPFSICTKVVSEALYWNHVRRAHKTFIGIRQGFPLSVNPSFDLKSWAKLSLCRFLSEALSNTVFNFYILTTSDNLSISVQFIGPTSQINKFSVTYRLSCGNKCVIRTGKPLPYNLSYCTNDHESSVFTIDKKTCIKTFRKGTLQIFVSVDVLPLLDT